MRKPEIAVFVAMTLALAAACAIGPTPATPVAAPAPSAATAPTTEARVQAVDPAMTAAARDPASNGAARSIGYLTDATTPDAAAIIPPAPKEGEPRNNTDWAIFKATRALEGSDRWKLAQNDDNYMPAALLKDFSCAVGVELTPQNSPTLAVMLGRVGTDASNAAANAKNIYKRTRPYLHNAGNICIEKSEGLGKSFDYPSGHSSLSWANGLMIAELAPDRATQVLTRARAYGESRIVCGVHNWSAVEGGRTNGASVFAALHGSSEFMTSMAKARQELDTLRNTGAKPDAAGCAKEVELTKPLPIQ